MTSWCFQPIWKICSSNWIISPVGMNIKTIWNHHLAMYGLWKKLTNIPSFTGHYITNPNNALLMGNPQLYHTSALFDAPQIGNLMIPVIPLPAAENFAKTPLHTSKASPEVLSSHSSSPCGNITVAMGWVTKWKPIAKQRARKRGKHQAAQGVCVVLIVGSCFTLCKLARN